MLVAGKDKNLVLLKDEKTINQRGAKKYIENCKSLYDNILKAEANNSFNEIFLDESLITNKKHKPSHEKCSMKTTDSKKVTEKRICRCMFYYNKDKDKCLRCPLGKKYNNISKDYEVVEAEKPMERVIKTCGGIDIVIKDKKNNTLYAVEVKPPKSDETIVRMVAEIYTYTTDFKGYKKAIGFFEGSTQEKDYNKYYDNEYFKNIVDKVTVFKFVEKKNKDGIVDFEIVRLGNNE